jgi:hypothetical protein
MSPSFRLADPTYQQEKNALGSNVLSVNGEPASDKIETRIARLDRFTGTTPDVAKQCSWGWIEYWGQQLAVLGLPATGRNPEGHAPSARARPSAEGGYGD